VTQFRDLLIAMADELDHCHKCLMDDQRLTHPIADRARVTLAWEASGRITADPVARGDKPLWLLMSHAYDKSPPGAIAKGYAAELRAVADWLEWHLPSRHYKLSACLMLLREQADRAEAMIQH